MVYHVSSASDFCSDDCGTPTIPDAASKALYSLQNDSFCDLSSYVTPGHSSIIPGVSNHLGSESYNDWCFPEFPNFENASNYEDKTRHAVYASPRSTLLDLERPFDFETIQLPDAQVVGLDEYDHTIGTGSWVLDLQKSAGHEPDRDSSQCRQDRKHECRQCHKSFATAYQLENHAKRLKHRTYICTEPGCAKGYSRRDVLLRHTATTHRPCEANICPFCPQHDGQKTFKRKDHLAQHIRNQHEHSCDKCEDSRVRKRTHCITEDGTCTGSKDRVETGLHLLGSMELEGSRAITSMPQKCQSETQEIASALRSIFHSDHPTVKMIERRLDPYTQSTREELALGLAQLALLEPESLPTEAKERLRNIPAYRSTP